ncbi:MAG: pyridoxal 5'-phosphate synthase glutaminase subunit PdxT [Candidatus Diapherotrites archaeon]|nr:pyridoxal 5'-phosphate synthase glutaminase subunit PdxT [Candidatus Diapherotrites archaeon]
MRIGVLGVQGAIEEHVSVLSRLVGAENVLVVRDRNELEKVGALIIPGGESTTISRLLVKNKLFARVKALGREGFPILGTCAGLISLAKQGDEQVGRTGQKLLGLLDVKVKRNAFGRQKDSFEAPINISVLGEKPFTGVFIRAPMVERVLDKGKVKILAKFNNKTIAVQQGNILATAFHPELSGDARFHNYFLSMV